MTTQIAALQAALAAEHAAVYGYGVAGAMLTRAALAQARSHWTAHLVARDTLEAMLTELGAVPVAASPAYELPFAVTGAASAKKARRGARGRRDPRVPGPGRRERPGAARVRR